MKKAKSNPESLTLRVLILEDNPADAELIERELGRAGIHFTSRLVDNKKEFIKALLEFHPQVILSDFKLPRFGGMAALEIARQQAPDIPFVFVSGSIGEEKAIETLTLGARDYIFKDNLARLGPAVERAIEEARLKNEKTKTDKELHRRAEELKLLAEAAEHFVQINDIDKMYEYLSQVIHDISGADYLLLSIYEENLQAVRPKIITGFEAFRETLRSRFHIDPREMVFYLKDMRADDFSDFVSRKLLPVRDGIYGWANRTLPRALCRDIEKLLDIDSIFSMGFSWENQLFGGLTLSFKKGNELKNQAQIEALLNQATVAIKRLLAERSLQKSEEKYRLIAENTADTITVLDLDLKFTYVSPAIFKLRGYTVEEALQLTLEQTMTPSSLAKVREVFAEEMALEGGGSADPLRSRTLELQEYHKNGSVIWIENTISFMRDPQGKVLGFLAVSKDISERKRIESALHQSEEKYRTLVIQSPDGIFIMDLQGNFLSVNQAMCDGLKYNEKELLSLKIADLVPEPYMDLQKKRLASILQGKPQNEAAEYEVQAKDGEIHHIAILSAPYYKDNQLVGFQGIARDITEKKKMEIRLRESEEYYRTLVETSPDAIIIVDGGGRVTFASPKTFEIFAVPAQTSLTGLSILDFVEPDEIPKVQGRLVEILSGHSLPDVREYRLLRHDRRPFWGEISSAPLRDAGGKRIGLLLVCRDISARKNHEEQIRYQADLLQKVSDAIIATDKSGRIQVWNKAAEAIYGWKAQEAQGKIFHDLIQPEYRYQHREEVTKKMEREGAWSGELVHHLRDGRQIPVQSTITMLKDAAGNPVGTVSINHDISERKRAEEQIRSSLKEKEVLLQEIHHRVKNNLQIISGLLTLQADQSAGKSLSDIFQESQDRIRSIALIHEKLYCSQNLAEIPFDEYLRALTANLFISHGVDAGRITSAFDLEAILFTIEKAIPLGLIVNELVTNALKHAFPAGRRGEIRIGLRGHLKGKTFVQDSDSGPLYRVQVCELSVMDDGVGLPTAQVSGQEKTLGMKLVSMLAQQLQAELKVTSGPGTEFRLIFPGMPAAVTPKNQPPQGGA
jgi:PAS domain S-box-containing protein